MEEGNTWKVVVLEERSSALDDGIWKDMERKEDGGRRRGREVGGRRSGRVAKRMCLETRRGKDGIEGDGDID